jgi:hypothetical protein
MKRIWWVFLVAVVLVMFPVLAFAQDVAEDSMGGFLGKVEQYGAIILQVVGLFAAIAAMTPNTSDNKIVDMLYKVMNMLGLNVGKAKNQSE